MSMICVSLINDTVSGMVASAEKSKSLGTDLIEVRADYLKEPSLSDLKVLSELGDNLGLPMILTIRPAWEGGNFKDTEDRRTTLLDEGIECGFDYLDLELKMDEVKRNRLVAKAKENKIKTIISSHDFQQTPSWSEIFAIMKECTRVGGYMSKAAFTCNDYGNLLNIIKGGRATINLNRPFSVMGMGTFGDITRIMAPFIGCEITYASVDLKEKAVEGQIDVRTILELWDAIGCI